MTAQIREILRVIDEGHEWKGVPYGWVVRIKALEGALAEADAEIYAVKKRAELAEHQVITCGVVAEGKEHLNPIYQEGGKWDSKQAGDVRKLWAEIKRLRDALEDMVWQFAARGMKDGKGVLTHMGLSALEQAFDALGWDSPKTISLTPQEER